MRITSIDQAKAPTDDGLAPIAMRQLRRIVLLSGPNGSGKSRMLTRVQNGGQPSHRANWGRGFQFEGTQIAPVQFVSKNLALSDPAAMTAKDALAKANSAETPGANHLASSALAYIQRVQTHAWNASHQDSPETDSVKRQKVENYKSLCDMVETVLGVQLGSNLDNIVTLFGKPIAEAALSDGQRALLQWCAALHAQGAKLQELVLLMDEPENHLHPESMISTIERIVDANRNGQVWIATHSVPLIAALYKRHSDDLSVYYMSDGVAGFAGERPERILRSLMGGEANIEALREFIDLPEVFATNRFAAQCLNVPDVVASQTPNDPQVAIVDQDAVANPTVCNLLDFGCGKGRVLDSLLARHGDDLQKVLNYVGWDVGDSNKPECERVLERAYGTAQNRWFCDRQELAANYPSGSFDRVLMCNVLHEIDPTDWVSTFNATSIVTECLSDNGALLLIEDYLMPKGEYAHPFGFIVLDTQALQKLFSVDNTTDQITVSDERNGRIKGHLVPKSLLANVTTDSLKLALEFAQRNAQEQVQGLRNSPTADFRSGRAHGFWVQQYANTTLAIQQLS